MSITFPLQVDGQLDPIQEVPHFKSVAGAGNTPLVPGTQVLDGSATFSPMMVMKQVALENNLQQLAAFCKENGVLLAAHGKTSMAPAILRRAITEGGAWGLSAATPAQVRALRQFGIRNVFLANELVDPAGIRWIGQWQQQHPDHSFLCYVDSLRGVQLLEQNLGTTPVSVLLEMSVSGGELVAALNRRRWKLPGPSSPARYLTWLVWRDMKAHWEPGVTLKVLRKYNTIVKCW